VARWLSIVGIGEDGLDGLSSAARALVDGAEVLIGGERHLAMVPDDGRERMAWPTPLITLVDEIVARRDQKVCVLATGDPLYYGVGVTLARRVPIDEMTIVPGPSAFALAAARLGWPRAETETLTLHGRPVSFVQSYIQPGARLLILSENRETPAQVAALLVTRGYGESRITVLEHMGGAKDRQVTGTAADWRISDVADFNTVAVECIAGADARLLPRAPGLPDDAFEHDGQLTKREVRAATLAALAPIPGQLLWDIGAGSGAIGIEWMRSHFTCRAIAVERDHARASLIAVNADRLGTPKLEVIEAEAPAALAALDAPNAVFIGGGIASDDMLETGWGALSSGGRLVANTVTLEGEQKLFAWRQSHGGALSQISISHAETIGGFTGWAPSRPVTQYAATKP
jgi:precorrin-6Y C5,15-methyltransferase (decarboxylating)